MAGLDGEINCRSREQEPAGQRGLAVRTAVGRIIQTISSGRRPGGEDERHRDESEMFELINHAFPGNDLGFCSEVQEYHNPRENVLHFINYSGCSRTRARCETMMIGFKDEVFAEVWG